MSTVPFVRLVRERQACVLVLIISFLNYFNALRFFIKPNDNQAMS